MTPHNRAERWPECCGFEHSEAVEDYLKVLHGLCGDEGGGSTSAIAGRMGVSPPSVSAMMHRLSRGGLVERDAAGRFVLTTHGGRHARDVVRRHRLMETFLAQVLEVPWEDVHAEAEVLEHALSARLEARIDTALGHPVRDPHGDPIPPKGGEPGEYSECWPAALDQAAPGTTFHVERVSDRDSAALRYLGERGIRPGATVLIEERDPFGGPLWVSVDGRRYALGEVLTRVVHGVVAAPPP